MARNRNNQTVVIREENDRPVVNVPPTTTSGTFVGRGGGSGLTYHQTAVIYDALSEGPIEGLVDQGASIKLGGNRAYNYGDKDIVAITEAVDVNYTASTGVIIDHNSPSFFQSANTAQGSRDILIVGGQKRGNVNCYSGNSIITSTNTSVLSFSASDVYENDKRLVPLFRIEGGGTDGTDFSSKIVEFINTSAVRLEAKVPQTGAGAYALPGKLDRVATVSSYDKANNKVTVASGGIDTSNTTAILSTPERTVDEQPLAKYDNFLWAFRNGEREQDYLITPAGVGSGSLAYNVTDGQLDTVPNTGYPTWSQLRTNLGRTSAPNYIGTAKQYTASGSGSMGVSDPGEVDLIRLTFNFPQGCYKYKAKDNTLRSAGAVFRITFSYERNGTTYTTLLNGASSYAGANRLYGHDPDNFYYVAGGMTAKTKQPFNYIFEYDISQYQPFDNYTIKVERINEIGGERTNWVTVQAATLKHIENIILDKLNYPYTAYAGVIVDAQDFNQIPARSYEIRGLKVKVPTNYFPKDEIISTTGVRRTTPSYSRNVTTGADTSAYVDWDGNFRGDEKTFSPRKINGDIEPNYATVYTSNPVWIFMDLMTNPRYGLGSYIDPDFDFSRIDRYTLYALAKYCDELVPDGKGGVEPRFECNVYISKSTNALKILKDFCTTMRSMLVWYNGTVTLGTNVQKGAVYTFTKSNVIEGDFSYAGTSTRFRDNQVIVTWNNPERGYKQETTVVEDNDNIAKTGQVKTKNVTAFGCTSEAQAIRFGKWHLFSGLYEEEMVSFSTGPNAAMLRPGDVINVQDPDLHDIAASGRVTTTSSSTTTVIKTDRDITGFLNTDDNFDLHLIYPRGGAYLAQQEATINGVTYRQGDLVTADESGTAIDDETEAANCKDDAGALVHLIWSDEIRVETKPISAFDTSSVTVSSAFSSAPNGEVIYSVSGKNEDGGDVTGSLKQYMITSIKENFEDMKYDITAAEYDVTKFEKIDRGYVIPEIPDVMRPPKDTDAVPEPRNIVLSIVATGEGSQIGGTAGGKDLLVEWAHPIDGNTVVASLSESGTSSSSDDADNIYEHLAGYEISFKHPSSDQPEKYTRVSLPSKNVTSFNIPDIGGAGPIIVRLRTINSIGVTSSWVQRTLEINEDKIIPFGIPTLGIGLNGGIMRGGILSCGISVDSTTGTTTFEDTSFTYDSPSTEPGTTITISSGNSAMTTQAEFDHLADGETGYLLLDHDANLARGTTRTDLLQPLRFKTENTTEDADGNKQYFEYITRLGESNEDIVAANGTITITENTVELSGSSTTFESDFQAGDVIILGDAGTSRFFSTVGHIDSNTSLTLTTTPTRTYSGGNVYRQALRISNSKDAILAAVTNTGGVFSLTNFSSGNRGQDAYTINGTNENHNFPSNAAGLVTDFSSYTNSYTVNKGTISYSFANSGTATNTFGITVSSTNCTAVVNSSTGAITVTAIAADTASITVTITDRGTGETIATRIVSLGKSIPGAAGAGTDSRTVNLTASDYSIVYAADGTTPTPSGNITLTATAQNFTNPFFKFTGDGISDEGSFTANGSNTTTDQFTFSIPSTINTQPQTIKVGVADGNQTELAFDTITLTSLQQGSQGTDGAPAYTAIVTNEAHTFPASDTGAVSSFSDSGTKIEVYKGATQLTPVANTGTPSTGQYTVTTSATNITVGTFTLNTGSEKNVTVGDHSGVATGTDLSEIEYSIDIENQVTLTKAQTFTKSKQGTDGEDGDNGKKVQEIILYYPLTFNGAPISAPGAPTTGTYNFSTGVIASIPAGWQQDIPTGTDVGFFYFSSEALAIEGSTANVSGTLSWSTPGNNRNPANQVEFIFQRSENQPSTPSITNYPTLPSSPTWYDDIGDVPSGAGSIWVSKGTTAYDINGGSHRFRTTWQTPTRIEGSDGDDGSDGTNNATLTLYKRSTSGASAPAVPDGNVTYTFSSSSVTNTADLDGWSLNEVPTGTAQYLWSCSATASSNTATDVIATGEWSTPAVQSEAQQPRIEMVQVFYDAWAYGALPSAPSATGFNFTSKTLSGLTSGWSQTLGVIPFAHATLTVKEATFGSTVGLTITSGPVRPAGGKWELFDPDSIDFTIDDANNKIKFRPDNSINYKEATIADKYRNDQISITKENGAIRLTNTGENTDVGFVKGDVGLGDVDNVNQATIITNARANTTKADVGLSAVDNVAQATIITNARANTTAADVGLENVTNVNQATIITNARANTTKADVGLSAVDNVAQATIITNARANTTAADVGLDNVTNESKATMFASPTFTGTVAGVSKSHVGLGSVLNQEQIRKDLVGAPSGVLNSNVDADHVGLGDVDNVSQSTIITNARANTTKADVGLSSVDNVSQSTIITNARANTTKADVGLSAVDNVAQATIITNARANTTKADVGLSNVPNTDATNATNISSGTIPIARTPTTVRNSTIQLSAAGVLTGAGTSTQVNVGSIANSPFDTSGNVDTGETITVGSKITIDRDNERILIED